jgi:hypothetical protein
VSYKPLLPSERFRPIGFKDEVKPVKLIVGGLSRYAKLLLDRMRDRAIEYKGTSTRKKHVGNLTAFGYCTRWGCQRRKTDEFRGVFHMMKTELDRLAVAVGFYKAVSVSFI